MPLACNTGTNESYLQQALTGPFTHYLATIIGHLFSGLSSRLVTEISRFCHKREVLKHKTRASINRAPKKTSVNQRFPSIICSKPQKPSSR
jgi:hypothetical protein